MNTKYQDYLKSDDWKKKRRSKHKAGKKCALCMSGTELHIHHLQYRNLVDVEKNDLRVLCSSCHKKVHDLIDSGKLVFKSDNSTKRFKQVYKVFKKYHPECLESLKLGIEKKRLIREKYQKIEIFEAKNPEIVQVVTKKIIDMGKSFQGGWNGKQMLLFGFKDTSKCKGWQKMVIGQEWARETVSQFINLKNKHLK